MKKPHFFCDFCGKEVPGAAKTCPFCAKNFTSVRCPRCGFTAMANKFKFGCPTCGYSSTGSAASDGLTEPGYGDSFAGRGASSRDGRGPSAIEPLSVWTYILAAFLLLFSLGGLILLLLR